MNDAGEPDNPDDLRTTAPPAPLHLERRTYRRRRVVDAARLLPLFGAALLLVPISWTSENGTAHGTIYIFFVWLIVILVTAFLSRRLAEPLRRRDVSAEDTEAL